MQDKVQITTINFVTTKGGHMAAIVNGKFSVVKKEGAEPLYSVYQNVAKGIELAGSKELEREFSEAFANHAVEVQRNAEQERKRKIEEERKRIEKLEESVKGLTPADFADYYNIKTCETASHWNQLYNGKSSFAFIISSERDNELVEIAERVNNWGGRFGELRHRAGEHHNTFEGWFLDIEDYRKRCLDHFGEKYFFKSQETEEEFYFSELQDKIESGEFTTMQQVKEWVSDFENIEAGYYGNSGNLEVSQEDIDNGFFGYDYDVYSYSFGYNLPSKTVFYNGIEPDDED